MLTIELHEAAVDFGRALSHAPAVSIYRAAAAALDADPAAQRLLTELRQRQTTIVRLQQSGGASQDEVDAFRLCQAAIRANQTIMAHLRATGEVRAFLPDVVREVSATLGVDYASLIAPTSC